MTPPQTLPSQSNPDFDHIIVHVRHAEDPFLYIEAMTQDRLDFGSKSGDIRSVGGVFFVVGALLGIQPCYLIYVLCKRKDDMDRRLKQYERVMGDDLEEEYDENGGRDGVGRLTERNGGGGRGGGRGGGEGGWVEEDGIELSIREGDDSINN